MSGIFNGVTAGLNVLSNGVQAGYNAQDGNRVGFGINLAQIGMAVVAPRLGRAAPFVNYHLDKAGAASDTVQQYRTDGKVDLKSMATTWAPVAVSLGSMAIRNPRVAMFVTAAQTGYGLYGAYQTHSSHQKSVD